MNDLLLVGYFKYLENLYSFKDGAVNIDNSKSRRVFVSGICNGVGLMSFCVTYSNGKHEANGK